MSSVPKQRHFYGLNQLHYVTTSTYRRARRFDSERFKRQFVTTWQDLREQIGFPDHRLRLEARTYPHSALAVGAG